MDSLHKVFTKEYLAKLESLSLNISSKVNSGYTGARKSIAKGNSLEFADFRDYTPGDDIRRLDWNSFSRLDKLFIKLFTEEKQAVINIFLDKSKSMDFGNINKYYFSKIFAATVSYLAIKNADKVNIFCCDKTISLQKSNVSTKNLFNELISFLDKVEAEGETSLNKSISESRNMYLGNGLSFIISDFFSNDGFKDSIKLLQNKKQDVILVHVLDEEEISPTISNATRLLDLETKAFEDIFISTDIINKYKKVFTEYRNDIIDFCQKRGVKYLFAPTHENIIKLIVS